MAQAYRIIDSFADLAAFSAVVWKADGTRTAHHYATAAARGSWLSDAVAAASSGDVFQLGPTSFDLANDRLLFPAGVSMMGAGIGLTTITGSLVKTGGSIIRPGTGSIIKGFTFTGTAAAGVYQLPIGWYLSTDGASVFSDATIEDVRTVCGSDGIYMSYATTPGSGLPANCILRLKNCIFESWYDTTNIYGGVTLEIDNCQFLTYYDVAKFNMSRNGLRLQGGVNANVCRMRGGCIRMTGGASGHINTAVTTSISDTVELSGVHISTSESFDVDLLNGGYSTTIAVNGCQFDPAKVSGAITMNPTYHRTAASDPLHATAGSRPKGFAGETVVYGSPHELYECTDGATPTWVQVS
jgi:hypothetical protein